MIEIGDNTYEETIVQCPSCSASVRALIVLHYRQCPQCSTKQDAFFAEADSSERSDETTGTTETNSGEDDGLDLETATGVSGVSIQYPFDGQARTVSK